MRTLDSETTSESNSTQHLEPVKEDDINNDTLPVPDQSSSPTKQNRQPRDANTPKKKVRGRALSTSTLSPGAGSGNLKNHSISSIGSGRHSVHTSGHSSHTSQHPSNSSSGGSGSGSGTAVRTRTVSVGSKPVSSSSSTASQRRPNSGHASHREKRHSTPSQSRT